VRAVTVQQLTDPAFREKLAADAYYREKMEAVAADREHELDDGCAYFVLHWDSLSDTARAPYRTSVAEALDTVLQLEAA
jgi:hypothetical protein